MGLDDDAGVSVFASSYYDLDYAELSGVPECLLGDGTSTQPSPEVSALLRRMQKPNERKTPVLGFPVRLKQITSKKGWTGFVLEPIFLISLDEEAAFSGRGLRPTEEPVAINPKFFKSLAFGDGSNVMQELALLSEELGLWDTDAPGLSEFANRLFKLRPDWDWQEQPDPSALSSGQPLSKLDKPVIYNRAIIVGVERSPYTKGLEAELNQLMQVSESDLKKTALGYWLAGNSARQEDVLPEDIGSLIEPLPLNQEQRAACTSALTRRLTVVTGPPGTGKSQLVSALLVNAVTRSKKVLFASKNHKAVDVVESRVNALGPRPVLLRVGHGTYQSQLAEYIASLLGSQTSDEDRQEFTSAREQFKEITDQVRARKKLAADIMELRNSVDEMESLAEAARTRLGPRLFTDSQHLEIETVERTCQELLNALCQAKYESQPLLGKIFWSFTKQKRFRAVCEIVQNLQPTLKSVGLPVPTPPSKDADVCDPEVFRKLSIELIEAIEIAKNYHSMRSELAANVPIEEHHAILAKLLDAIAESSSALWEAWLRLVPSRLSPGDRDSLGNLLAVLRLIIDAQSNGDNAGRQLYAKFYQLFPRVANILPAWAVTSLSAKGRIPFSPGFFDLLVIDEASQCDIASALPLLYRAKAAVIIGDPQQLQHISNISSSRDTNLLLQNNLLETHARWSYSANSLFGLSSSLVTEGDVTMLLDHHRSHPDIIGFSNEHFYQGKLRVATKLGRLKTVDMATSLRWVDVAGSVSSPSGSGAENQSEARRIVEELERLCLHQNYQGSIGVVTPFRAQANLINRLIADHPHSSAITRVSDFLCDTVHRFQGDERDVMIFSPVYSQGISKGAEGFLAKSSNLFNVAITRARASLVVVGDLSAASQSAIPHLRSFAEYVRKNREPTSTLDVEALNSELTESYPSVRRPQLVSDWERILYRELFAAGIRPIPQLPVEKYVLDFAIFDGDRRLDIEVDGERYHRRWDGEYLYRDQLRNLRLIELGWDVMRFWIFEIRDDLSGCVERVKAWQSSKPGTLGGPKPPLEFSRGGTLTCSVQA